VAVNEAMRNYCPSNTSGEILSAHMTAPDQSLCIVSHFLSEMSLLSSIPMTSQTKFAGLFTSKFGSPSELDAWFLRGDSVELGVTLSKNESEHLIHEVLVARCLWERNWREEWCGIYNDRISFYAPLTKKAVFILSLVDILCVRVLNLADDDNPLPGLPHVVIESLGRCHYLAFNSSKSREAFLNVINSAIFCYGNGDESSNKVHSKDKSKDAWKPSQWANVLDFDAISITLTLRFAYH